MKNFSASAGIAIGPILFVIFILGIVAAAFASSSGVFSGAISIDRISSDIAVQTGLIKSAVSSCKAKSALRISLSKGQKGEACLTPSGQGYPLSGSETYPERALVRELVCSPMTERVDSLGNCYFVTDNDGFGKIEHAFSIWNLEGSQTVFPSPPKGFRDWEYINAEAPFSHGGVCAWISPVNPDSDNVSFTEGLIRAAAKFNSAVLPIDSPEAVLVEAIKDKKEVVLAVSSQKFIIWLRPPQSLSSANPNCLP
ncbi:MAG: hypothetical protein FWF23_02120 [Alphaproteobacteria bacterium]|nr:hypothetical protein [Alphaproteobacteria bacterium]MCL2504733.1 hypothetical protein [Alphaproteobacteria bacterium]